MNDDLCPECGAPLNEVSVCRGYLDKMITWDFEDFAGVGQIHHLTVLSYNLQHPSVYSPEGLESAKKSLAACITHPLSYTEHGTQDRKNLGSDVRTWKIVGTQERHGVYMQKPKWSMRASDVVHSGIGQYVENVKKWSETILKALEESGNLN